jgi:hypothetical protein
MAEGRRNCQTKGDCSGHIRIVLRCTDYMTEKRKADKNLEQTIGMQFKMVALTDAATTAQFIGDRIIDVRAIAGDPAIVDAVKASDRQYLGVGEEAIAARVQKIEGQWDTANADSRVKDMVSSRASRWLKQQRGLNRRMLKIIVSDENGAAVAATGTQVHYVEADQQRWQAVYASGKGAVNVSGVRYDASTQSDYRRYCCSSPGRRLGSIYGCGQGSGRRRRSPFSLRPTTPRSFWTGHACHEQRDDCQRAERDS